MIRGIASGADAPGERRVTDAPGERRAAGADRRAPVSPLDALELLQRTARERLAAGDWATLDGPGGAGDRALVVRLLETSCLLELSKLVTARLDLASYAQGAVDVLTQLFPVSGCALQLTGPDLPRLTVWSGGHVTELDAHESVALDVEGTEIGRLLVGATTVDVGPTTFFQSAAHELAAGIATVGEAEAMRRRAAHADALRAASILGEADVESTLVEITTALAALPGSLAAELTVDHDFLGPPIVLRSGYWDTEDGTAPRVVDLERDGLRLRMRLADAADVTANEPARQVIDVVAGALERLARTRRLEEETETDPLTGLGNRRRLARVLHAAVARAHRYGERVAVICCDLDRFKRVNDLLGHAAGDEVLRATAAAMQSSVRGYDDVVRHGGEEFVIVCPSCDIVGALSLAERLRVRISEQCATVLPSGWKQTTSIGISVYPDTAIEPEALLQRADEALYRAKDEGRDTVCVAVPYELRSDVDGAGLAAGSPAQANGLRALARRFLPSA